MIDPLSIAAGGFKIANVIKGACSIVERFSRANTEQFIAECDDMHRDCDDIRELRDLRADAGSEGEALRPALLSWAFEEA